MTIKFKGIIFLRIVKGIGREICGEMGLSRWRKERYSGKAVDGVEGSGL
jgi:hypothetical protein